MTQEHDVHRRSVLKGTAALGAAASVAGCSGILGGGGGSNADLSYSDEVQGELTEDDSTTPMGHPVGEPHTFEGSEGDAVRITMDSTGFDTRLLLVDSEESAVARNDDRSFGNLNSTIETTLPKDDTYTIWATSFGGSETGQYTLELEEQ